MRIATGGRLVGVERGARRRGIRRPGRSRGPPDRRIGARRGPGDAAPHGLHASRRTRARPPSRHVLGRRRAARQRPEGDRRAPRARMDRLPGARSCSARGTSPTCCTRARTPSAPCSATAGTAAASAGRTAPSSTARSSPRSRSSTSSAPTARTCAWRRRPSGRRRPAASARRASTTAWRSISAPSPSGWDAPASTTPAGRRPGRSTSTPRSSSPRIAGGVRTVGEWTAPIEARDGHAFIDVGQNIAGWLRLVVRGSAGDRVEVRHAEVLEPDGSIHTKSLRTATRDRRLRARPRRRDDARADLHVPRLPVRRGDRRRGRVGDRGRRLERRRPALELRLRRTRASSGSTPTSPGRSATTSCRCPPTARSATSAWAGPATPRPSRRPRAPSSTWSRSGCRGCATSRLDQDADGAVAAVVPNILKDPEVPGRGRLDHDGPGRLGRRRDDRAVGGLRVLRQRRGARAPARQHAPLGGESRGPRRGRRRPAADRVPVRRLARPGCPGRQAVAGEGVVRLRGERVLRAQRPPARRRRAARGRRRPRRARRSASPIASRPRPGSDGAPTRSRPRPAPRSRSSSASRPSRSASASARASLATSATSAGASRRASSERRSCCFALVHAGHVDEAYLMLLRLEAPSWLYQVEMGATTVWERWDALAPDGTIHSGDMATDDSSGMLSFNHYAYGAVVDWIYRYVGGHRPDASSARATDGSIVAPRPSTRDPLGEGVGRVPPRPGIVDWRLDGGDLEIDARGPVRRRGRARPPDHGCARRSRVDGRPVRRRAGRPR